MKRGGRNPHVGSPWKTISPREKVGEKGGQTAGRRAQEEADTLISGYRGQDICEQGDGLAGALGGGRMESSRKGENLRRKCKKKTGKIQPEKVRKRREKRGGNGRGSDRSLNGTGMGRKT